MALSGKRAIAKKTIRNRLLKGIYWAIFSLSLVIVLVYAAFRIFIRPPEVEGNVIIDPHPQSTSDISSEQPGSNLENDPPAPSEVVLTRKEGVYTCLLAGSDDGNGNADTIMLGVFDTVNNTASLVSIPRDSLVNVNGKNRKINSTYGIGGVELLCQTVSDTLTIPVDYYVLVSLQAFERIVNEIGGVYFTVPQDMDYEDPVQDLYIHIKAGYQLLNGKDALGVMRFRHGYSNQDLGRAQTQRAFLTALVKQTVTLSNVSKVSSLIKILNQYVSSNMPVDTMIYFGTQAIGMDLSTNLTSVTLPGEWIYPFYELDDDKVLDIINSLGIYETELTADLLNIRHAE